ncbi:MAG: hypothetical protein HY567_04625 [Candidatus Kerfeldbacteria bacterium]|nr:hypothetical protein [Candidatus Kerfeldbacteria bacterium]
MGKSISKPRVIFINLDQEKFAEVAARGATEAVRPALLREVRRRAGRVRPLIVVVRATTHPGYLLNITSGSLYAAFLRRKAGAAVVIDDFEDWSGFGHSPEHTMTILASGLRDWRRGRKLNNEQLQFLEASSEEQETEEG